MEAGPPAAVRRCERGATAVEFALVFPALALLVIGTMFFCGLLFSAASMHYAVEQAARCYSVNSVTCGDAAATQAYAATRYNGMGKPRFTASVSGCGHHVNATATFEVAFVSGWKVPLSATACYP